MLRPGHLSFLTGADVVRPRLQKDFELGITLVDGVGMLPQMFATGIWQGISLMASIEPGSSLNFDGILLIILYPNSINVYKCLQALWDLDRIKKACCKSSRTKHQNMFL